MQLLLSLWMLVQHPTQSLLLINAAIGLLRESQDHQMGPRLLFQHLHKRGHQQVETLLMRFRPRCQQ